MRSSPSRARPRLARRTAWLAVVALTAAALIEPGTLPASAAEPRASADPSPSAVVTPEPTALVTPEPSAGVTPPPTPVVTPEPTAVVTPEPTPQPSGASILIAKIDNNGTADPSDDVFLDGARFAAHLDDGDSVFEDGDDELVYGPAPTVDSLLDTDLLVPGAYWIVETVVPTGFVGTAPILVELNTDPTITCIWDFRGLFECVPNDGEVEDLSWTIVIVDNTPVGATPSGTGGVGGATGRPHVPGPTLPPTDTLRARPSDTAPDGWPFILVALAGLLATTLVRTPARTTVRRDDAQD